MAKAKNSEARKDVTTENVLDIFVNILVNEKMASLSSEFGRTCKLSGIDSKNASVIALRALKRVVDKTLARKEAELVE